MPGWKRRNQERRYVAKTANSAKRLYQLIGSEESPYSVKVRAYLRYKSLPHQWLSRA